MRTHTITTYSAAELKAQFPDGFARALESHVNYVHECGVPWQEECFDSLKGIIDAAGLALRDYELTYGWGRSFIKVDSPYNDFYEDDPLEISGSRAVAWLENNLFGQFRIPWKLNKKYLKYNTHYTDKSLRPYSPGKVEPCPITGVCYDEDYLDHLVRSVRSGDTIREAFNGLASVYQSIMETEYEHETSEESFLEMAKSNEWEYTASGRQL